MRISQDLKKLGIYSLAGLFSLALHGFVIFLLLVGWTGKNTEPKPKRPNFVQATLVQMAPQAKAENKQAADNKAKAAAQKAAAQKKAEKQRNEKARKQRVAEQKKAERKKAEQKKAREEKIRRDKALKKKQAEEKARKAAAQREKEEQEKRAKEAKREKVRREHRLWQAPSTVRMSFSRTNKANRCLRVIRVISNSELLPTGIARLVLDVVWKRFCRYNWCLPVRSLAYRSSNRVAMMRLIYRYSKR